MTKTVKLTREQLGVQKDEMIVIEGIVSYAKVDKLVEGEALIAESKRRVSLNMIAADKPFRSISITEPRIVKGEGTPLAAYHGQNVYTDKNGVKAMSLESKSQYAPKYGHIQNNVLVEIPDPMKNPAPGQKVLLFIQAYGSKQYSKIGSSFNAIVFPEGDIKFYEGGNGGGNGLAGFGQALDLPVQNLSGQAPTPANMLESAPAAAAPVEQPVANGFGTAPVQTQQPVTNGFGGAPVQPTEPATPPLQEQFAGFGQAPAQPATAGRSSNPFA